MNITEIKGIGPKYAKKLKRAGIKTVYDLRKISIKKVAEITGIGEQVLAKWKDEAMNMRLLTDIKGIGDTLRKKLEKIGISTIEDLANADKKIASKLGISEKRFMAWVKEAKKMIVTPKEKKAVVAEDIGPKNAFITIKGKRAEVKIKEKLHENVPVYRGEIVDYAKESRIAVNIDSSGNVKLWFGGKWYENVPFKEETLLGKIKRIFGG